MTGRGWIGIGAASAALTVAFGAFGAHLLADRVTPEDLDIWRTAVLYQGLHALALVQFGLYRSSNPGGGAVGWSFLVGSAVFSSTLYGIVLGGPRWLGAITPIGGTAMIVGWVLFALAAWRGR